MLAGISGNYEAQFKRRGAEYVRSTLRRAFGESKGVRKYADAPEELQIAVAEFWEPEEWENAVSIAWLESAWSAFAENQTATAEKPCGTVISWRDGVKITAEWSIGWFQINACNLPGGWNPCHLFNTRHNVGTAHDLWERAGRSWSPWYFSAKELGLLFG